MKRKIEKKIIREWKNMAFNVVFAVLTLLLTILFYKKTIIASILIGIVSVVGLINIPFWLFLVWGNTGVFIYQTGLELKKLGVKS